MRNNIPSEGKSNEKGAKVREGVREGITLPGTSIFPDHKLLREDK